MVEAAGFAREAGASVLALTRSDTPLSVSRRLPCR